MKRFLQGTILGLSLALVVSVPIQTFAKTGSANLQAYYNNIKVMLNGNYVNLVDGNGKTVEPFIVDGTTYLPVRAVSEALGLPVEWDSANATVVMGTKPEGQGTSLTELGIFAGSYEAAYLFISFDEFKTNLDKKYYDGYEMKAGNGYYGCRGYADFLLNGQYTNFSAIIANSSKNIGNVPVTEITTLRIYGDDKILYTLEEYQNDDITEELINIDVTNVIKLRIEVDAVGNDRNYYGILNPTVK